MRRRAAAESAAVVVPPRGRGRHGGEQESRNDKPGHVSLRFHFPPSFPAKTHQKKWKALFLSVFLPSEVLWRLTLSAFGDLEKEEERERRRRERRGPERERERREEGCMVQVPSSSSNLASSSSLVFRGRTTTTSRNSPKLSLRGRVSSSTFRLLKVSALGHN